MGKGDTRGQRRGSARRRAAGMLGALVVLVATGCDPDRSRQQDLQQHTYEQPLSELLINMDSGDVTLAPGAEDRVVVERRLTWTSSEPTVTEDWDGETLEITTNCPNQRSCATDYTLTVPAGVAVTVDSVAGAITTRGIAGAQQLQSSAGHLEVNESTGALTLRTDSGRITGAGVLSPQVSAVTDAGDVRLQLAGIPDEVRTETTAGDVELAVPREGNPYHVVAETVVGTMAVDVDTDPSSPHQLIVNTEAGDIQVRYSD